MIFIHLLSLFKFNFNIVLYCLLEFINDKMIKILISIENDFALLVVSRKINFNDIDVVKLAITQ